MLITNLKTHLKVTLNEQEFYFEKRNLYQQLLASELLSKVSLLELKPLFIIGTPNNIKDFLKQKIQLYKESFNVNSFIYKNKEYWLDSKTRSSLFNLSQATTNDIEIVLGKEIIKMSPTKLQEFINKLEVYAYECFVVTSKHIIKADELTKLEDVMNYDYTAGYPEKITLE